MAWRRTSSARARKRLPRSGSVPRLAVVSASCDGGSLLNIGVVSWCCNARRKGFVTVFLPTFLFRSTALIITLRRGEERS